jgi:small GTP-binding protein
MSDSDGAPSVKVIVLGPTTVGKTAIVTRIVESRFVENLEPTVGAFYSSTSVNLGSKTVNLQLWDTAGQERFKALAPMYFRGVNCALIVFAITDSHSFDQTEFWISALDQTVTPRPVIFLVANKMDLAAQREVSVTDAEHAAAAAGAEYCEVSAKTGAGIDELIVLLAQAGATQIHIAHGRVGGTEKEENERCC